MASQTVNFKYDADRNILFADDDFEIASVTDAELFLQLYRQQLEAIGHKVWIVTSIDGLRVRADAYQQYGLMLKGLADRWYLGIARWGSDTTARMTVRTASRSAKYDINIHDTREQAVNAIELMRRDAEARMAVNVSPWIRSI
jgi:hypothetical protein